MKKGDVVVLKNLEEGVRKFSWHCSKPETNFYAQITEIVNQEDVDVEDEVDEQPVRIKARIIHPTIFDEKSWCYSSYDIKRRLTKEDKEKVPDIVSEIL